MFKEPTRNHWTFTIETVIKSLYQMVFLVILAFTNLDSWGLWALIGGVGFMLLISILIWYNTKFYIDNEELVINSGIIGKKKVEIPFKKINTVDINKNIVDKIFGVCTVKIDSGAMKAGEEAKFKIQIKEAVEFKKFILDNKKSQESHEEIVGESLNNFEVEKVEEIKRTITFKELALYAATKGKLLWAIGSFFIAMEFISQVVEFFETKAVDDALNSIDVNYFTSLDMVSMVLWGIGIFIIVYILITLIFLVFESIRLYKFTLISNGKNINITYGALTTKEYSIPIEKIHALRYKQGFLQQMLGVYNLEAVTIGYGDEQKEVAILYPIANKKFIEETVSKILPGLVNKAEILKAPKRSLSRFIIKRDVILALVLLPMFFIFKGEYTVQKALIYSIALVGNTILGYINYRNTSIGFDKDTILCSSGSIIKHTTIIKQSSVQSLKVSEGIFHRRKKVIDVSIDIYTNKLAEVVQVKNIDSELENELRGTLIL